jgi:hypothetical protein
MKPFLIWLVITVLVFGGLGGGYHATLTQNPRKVLVAVDSSTNMASAWPRVPETLRTLETQRYAVFCLVDKSRVLHSPAWQPALTLGRIVPYGPPDFSKLVGPDRFAEIEQAGQKYLITTAQSLAASPNLAGWTIIQLTP